MDVNKGNWFENQPKVAHAIQNLDAKGDLTGAAGAITALTAGAAGRSSDG